MNLPAVGQGEGVACEGIEAVGHSTQPPARYTEASLVKELEDRAIGRPSTYASIINTITNERGYVWKKGNALVPSWTAFAKTQLLERYFPHLVDYDFTATMEEALDEVAAGRGGVREVAAHLLLRERHRRAAGARVRGEPRQDRHERGQQDPHRRAVTTASPRSWCGSGTRVSRCTAARRSARSRPTWPPTSSPPSGRAELLAKGAAGPRELGVDPATGEKVLVAQRSLRSVRPARRAGGGVEGEAAARVALQVDGPRDDRPRRARSSCSRCRGSSVPTRRATRSPRRTVATGPYLRKGTDSRSLESEDQIFNITLEGAEAIFAQPKQRRGQAKPPLAELGPQPRHREAGARARRPLRSVLHGRHDERHDPARHGPGRGHARGSHRAAARAGGEGPGQEDRRRPRRRPSRRRRRRSRRRRPAKKSRGKKAAKRPAKRRRAVGRAGRSAALGTRDPRPRL